MFTSVFLMANLLKGIYNSDLTGQLVIAVQIVLSIWALQIFFSKRMQLASVRRAIIRFNKDFFPSTDVLNCYLQRKPGRKVAISLMYDRTCERMVRLLSPDVRNQVISTSSAVQTVALTGSEVQILRGVCEHAEEDECIALERKMSTLAGIVTTAPMLGLLGTVWGVMNAFDLMGGKGTVLLSEIAPAISSALATTVVGLLVAIPAAIAYNHLTEHLRSIETDMAGFREELMGRICNEYRGGDRQ